jgi:ribosomal protein S18 acetylase RimI-like enzyme
MGSATFAIEPIDLNRLEAVQRFDAQLFLDAGYPPFLFELVLDRFPNLFLGALDRRDRLAGYVIGAPFRPRVGCILTLAVADHQPEVGQALALDLMARFDQMEIRWVRTTVEADAAERIALFGAIGFKVWDYAGPLLGGYDRLILVRASKRN